MLTVTITIEDDSAGDDIQTTKSKSVAIEDHAGIGYDFLDLMWWLTDTLHSWEEE